MLPISPTFHAVEAALHTGVHPAIVTSRARPTPAHCWRPVIVLQSVAPLTDQHARPVLPIFSTSLVGRVDAHRAEASWSLVTLVLVLHRRVSHHLHTADLLKHLSLHARHNFSTETSLHTPTAAESRAASREPQPLVGAHPQLRPSELLEPSSGLGSFRGGAQQWRLRQEFEPRTRE